MGPTLSPSVPWGGPRSGYAPNSGKSSRSPTPARPTSGRSLAMNGLRRRALEAPYGHGRRRRASSAQRERRPSHRDSPPPGVGGHVRRAVGTACSGTPACDLGYAPIADYVRWLVRVHLMFPLSTSTFLRVTGSAPW